MTDAPTIENTEVPDICLSDYGYLPVGSRTEIWVAFHTHLKPSWMNDGVRLIITAEINQLFAGIKPVFEIYALLDEHVESCLSLVFSQSLPAGYIDAVGARLCAIRHLIHTGQLVMPPKMLVAPDPPLQDNPTESP